MTYMIMQKRIGTGTIPPPLDYTGWTGTKGTSVSSSDFASLQESTMIAVSESRALVFTDHTYDGSYHQGVHLKTVDVDGSGNVTEPSVTTTLSTDRPRFGKLLQLGNTGKFLVGYPNITNDPWSGDMAVVSVGSGGEVIQEVAPATFFTHLGSSSNITSFDMIPLDDTHAFVLAGANNNTIFQYGVVEYNDTAKTLTMIVGPTAGIGRDVTVAQYMGVDGTGKHMIAVLDPNSTSQTPTYTTLTCDPNNSYASTIQVNANASFLSSSATFSGNLYSYQNVYLGNNESLFGYIISSNAYLTRLVINPTTYTLSIQGTITWQTSISGSSIYAPHLFTTGTPNQYGIYIESYLGSSTYLLSLGYVSVVSGGTINIIASTIPSFISGFGLQHEFVGLNNYSLYIFRDSASSTAYQTTP